MPVGKLLLAADQFTLEKEGFQGGVVGVAQDALEAVIRDDSPGVGLRVLEVLAVEVDAGNAQEEGLREAKLPAVERVMNLQAPLAEGALAEDGGSASILKTCGDHLGAAPRVAIDQADHRKLRVGGPGTAEDLLVLAASEAHAVKLARRDEALGNAVAHHDHAAPVVTQVEDHAFNAGLAEAGEGRVELLDRAGAVQVGNANVSEVRVRIDVVIPGVVGSPAIPLNGLGLERLVAQPKRDGPPLALDNDVNTPPCSPDRCLSSASSVSSMVLKGTIFLSSLSGEWWISRRTSSFFRPTR